MERDLKREMEARAKQAWDDLERDMEARAKRAWDQQSAIVRLKVGDKTYLLKSKPYMDALRLRQKRAAALPAQDDARKKWSIVDLVPLNLLLKTGVLSLLPTPFMRGRPKGGPVNADTALFDEMDRRAALGQEPTPAAREILEARSKHPATKGQVDHLVRLWKSQSAK